MPEKEEKLSLFKLNKDLQEVVSALQALQVQVNKQQQVIDNLVGHVDTYNNHIKSLHM